MAVLFAGRIMQKRKKKRVVLMQIGWDGMDWIDLAQNRDQWKALVNTVMNLRVL
jgi:hypothetical protein